MTEEYKAGYQAAINDVCQMFDAEHTFYHQLWKSDADDEELHRSEIKLRTINDVIYTMERMCELRSLLRKINDCEHDSDV